MIKSNKGFSLVELIVVIAILAMLAGVAVPAYSGYLTKAKDAAVLSDLSAVVTASQAAVAAQGGVVDSIAVSAAGAVTVTYHVGTDTGKTLTDLSPFYTGTLTLTGTSYENGANWASGTWTAA